MAIHAVLFDLDGTLLDTAPHPAPVLLACEILVLDPAQVLMVGDNLRDVESGQAAGTHTAFASYGYVPEDFDPHISGADFLIEHPMQVLDLLAGRRACQGLAN